MPFNFTKMHCNGHDYIVLETFTQEIYDLFTLSLILPDRRCGIGGDALIEVAPCEDADAEVRIYSPDGSNRDVAGCAARCAVKLLYDQKICEKKERYRLKMPWGMVEAEPVSFRRRAVSAVCCYIDLPLQECDESLAVMVCDGSYRLREVSHQGEHCVLLAEENFTDVEGIEKVNLAAVASALNSLPNYKGRAVELLELLPEGDAKLRMWISGQGEARANANGVAAALMTLPRAGKLLPSKDTRIAVQGGEMVFCERDGQLQLTGLVQDVYDGICQL